MSEFSRRMIERMRSRQGVFRLTEKRKVSGTKPAPIRVRKPAK
jgi:hypothetical protein